MTEKYCKVISVNYGACVCLFVCLFYVSQIVFVIECFVM